MTVFNHFVRGKFSFHIKGNNHHKKLKVKINDVEKLKEVIGEIFYLLHCYVRLPNGWGIHHR